MTITPERRQRIIHAQLLQQRGHSLRQIAEHLNVSHATIHADLQLFDHNFPQLAQTTAHEHTFERLEYIADQLRQLASQDPLEPLLKYSRMQDGRAAPLVGEVTARDIVRLYGQHRTLTIALLREHRLTVDKLESAALTRLAVPESAESANHPMDQAEQDLTESTDSDHPETARPDREEVPEPTAEQNSANHPDQPNQPTRPSRAQRRRAEALARKAEKRQRKRRTAVA